MSDLQKLKWSWQELLVGAVKSVLCVEIDITPEPAERILKRTLRKAQSILSNNERAAIARMFFGTICLRARLAHIIHADFHTSDFAESTTNKSVGLVELLTAYKLLEEPRYFPHANANEPASPWLDYAAYVLGFERVSLLTRTQSQFALEWPLPQIEYMCVFYSMPVWLTETIAATYPSSKSRQNALAASLNQPARPVFRANLAKTTRAALAASLANLGINCEPTLFSNAGLRVVGPEKPEIRNNALYRSGFFEVQDEGSQLVSLATEGADIYDNMVVVDMCCGRGGKALHLADMMRRGILICHDVDANTLRQAKARLEKAGVLNDSQLNIRFVSSSAAVNSQSSTVIHGGRGGDMSFLTPDQPTVNADSAALQSAMNGVLADIVLVDAPCSSLGTLRRGPNVRWEINPANLPIFSILQQNILQHAVSLVKPGGILVYATCTFNKQECGDIKQWFEDEYAEMFEPEPLFRENVMRQLVGPDGDTMANSVQLTPSDHGTDAFFISKWKRKK
ncbi:hypothetical protein HK100_003894 [Physocladia obscura]|uniref:SAM-dependent MTase RsmB/NOP-type domain-containing protein n=1 Tax=Physocladia obscura TaxID=109957 RepID=A0AAD5STH3_9FUNG|nr:hypothetical protein HK100_003894 [Physocladia obscura]